MQKVAVQAWRGVSGAGGQEAAGDVGMFNSPEILAGARWRSNEGRAEVKYGGREGRRGWEW